MKRHLIFFLFLFCALMAVDGRNNPQLVDKRMHFADIYKEPEIAHFSDVPRYIFYEGELHNYVIYTFTIQDRSTLFIDPERRAGRRAVQAGAGQPGHDV